MVPSSVCLYCGTELVPSSKWGHWAFCPKCNPEWIAAEQPPDPAKLIQQKVGGLMSDKGRPYRNGRPA